jgi:hypothetical protein
MGKAARLQHRVERRDPKRIAWPKRYIVVVIGLVVACALVAYLILDEVGTSWVAPDGQGLGGRTPGALVALVLSLLVVLPFVPVIDRRLQRRHHGSLRR